MTTTYDVERIIADMGESLRAHLASRGITDPTLVGIYTGGVWVAERLHGLLGLKRPLGSLDISFYRDDFSRIGINPQVKPSRLPVSVDDRHIVLVDDVLYTGRTIRAAMNEIFDYGRPASVTLVVLAERTGRELPIQADVVGVHIATSAREHVKLYGPEPLRLTIVEGL
ncbi:MAG: bifunctional pyr operon transcriptional regulator/uracil phosphoribosyltransferase [Gammaproteobacteria bacterium RBG_16_57_12]|nr:MAG: bifunctional pyr operon transcriptional regulator/uracil phosphoribosyltransferase [Gammaproteobacteria bacterium RBG_16_57_12]